MVEGLGLLCRILGLIYCGSRIVTNTLVCRLHMPDAARTDLHAVVSTQLSVAVRTWLRSFLELTALATNSTTGGTAGKENAPWATSPGCRHRPDCRSPRALLPCSLPCWVVRMAHNTRLG